MPAQAQCLMLRSRLADACTGAYRQLTATLPRARALCSAQVGLGAGQEAGPRRLRPWRPSRKDWTSLEMEWAQRNEEPGAPAGQATGKRKITVRKARASKQGLQTPSTAR